MSTKAAVLKSIRGKCLDCVGGHTVEVKLCPSTDCPLWPFRMGKDQNRTPRQMTAAQRESLAKAQTVKKNGPAQRKTAKFTSGIHRAYALVCARNHSPSAKKNRKNHNMR